MKKLFVNGGLITISLIVALLLGEIMCRMMLDPANYLSAELVSEPVLGHRVAPESPGYDRWGFRNDSVPDEADIVAIGDSQTYGNNATKDEAWPQSLESLINKTVYNMGMGSYGAAQYYHLFKTKALKLNPDRILVGYYAGNDLMDSYYMSYYNEHWHHLRDSSFAENIDRSGSNIVDDYLQQDSENKSEAKFLGGLRSFLSHNSFLYRLIIHGPLLAKIKLKAELLFKDELAEEFSRLEAPKLNIEEGFRPTHRANKLDLQNPRIEEGFQISLDLIKEMKKLCDQQGIAFSVVLIPTKEFVFENYLRSASDIKHHNDIQRLLNNEQKVRTQSIAYFDSLQIDWIDPLPELRSEIGQQKIYPPTYDDHPNAYGYSIIAKGVQKHLDQQLTESKD